MLLEAAEIVSISPCAIGDGTDIEEDDAFGDFHESELYNADDAFVEVPFTEEENPQGKESTEN